MKQISNDRGAVLIAGLLILVILSLLGITTMQTSTIEEKMTNNMNQRQLAFQAAEAGLREAEGRIINDGLSVDPTLPLLTPAAPGSTFLWNTANRWTSNDTISGSQVGTGVAGVVAQPRYMVEVLAEIPKGDEVLDADAVIETETMYRVTALGVGPTNTSQAVLQVTYLR